MPIMWDALLSRCVKPGCELLFFHHEGHEGGTGAGIAFMTHGKPRGTLVFFDYETREMREKGRMDASVLPFRVFRACRSFKLRGAEFPP